MPRATVVTSELECPLCHTTFEVESALRSHLITDHEQREVVSQLMAHVDALDRGRFA